MIENFRLDKLFGPSGVTAGYIVLFFGMITIYFTLTAIPLIILGCIMAFSYRGTKMRMDKKRYQSYLALFGIIKTGVWLPFEKSDTLLVEKFKGKYISSGRSNRRASVLAEDFRILLKTSYNDKKIAIARFQDEKSAIEKAKEIEAMINALKV